MKRTFLFVMLSSCLLAASCTDNKTTPEQTTAEVVTVAPAIEEPDASDQTIGQRIDTANAALQQKTAEVKQDVKDAADTAKKGMKKAVEAVKEGAKKAATEVKSAATAVKKDVKESTGKAAAKVEQKAKAVKEKMDQ